LVLAAAFAVMMLGWSWRQRANALVGAVFVLPVVWMIAPRLVDVLGGLFTETEDDFSVQARIDRIPRIMATFRERPWFGRGNGTWSVEENFLIDGEVWVTLLETGIIGLALTFVLLAVAVRAGLGVKHLEGADPEMAHLGTALAAAIVGIGVSFGTFDALHYRILTGTLFLLIGAVAAVYRLALPAPPETPPETIETGSARSALR
jgi:O-antigen ligase